MTKLFDDAVEAVRRMPPEAQDDVARMMLSMAGSDEFYELTAEERAVIEQSMAEAARGEFVPDEKVQSFWKRFGL